MIGTALRRGILGLLAVCLPLLAARADSTAAAPSLAQIANGAPIQPAHPPAGPAADSPTAQAPPAGSAAAIITQPIQVQAGTGVLLRLPQPAATVISAGPDIARVQPASPTSLFLMGVAPGRTTVLATNSSGAAIVQSDVTVTPAAGTGPGPQAAGAPEPKGVSPATARAIQAAINQTVQGATDVQVRAAGDDAILHGTVTTAVAAQQAVAIARAYVGEKGGVVNELLVLDTIQVNVRVRIAEINRQITRQLGFNWQALANSTWRFGLLTGAAASGTISALSPLGVAPLQNSPAVPNQIGLGYHSGSWDVNNVIDALAADQLITILAEPNLTAQSGETASFLAGGEFPIPVAGTSTGLATTITVVFKPYGVSLAVVPTVLSGQRLNLRIRPEVSQPDQQRCRQPADLRRHAGHSGAQRAAGGDDHRAGQRPELRDRRAAGKDQPQRPQRAALDR